jgi:hypothetical protein
LSFLERFIPEVAASGRSCAQIYSLAVEQYGEDPRRKRKAGRFHAVRLPEKLFHALAVRASSPDKTHLLVVQILSEWEQQQGAGKASVPDTESLGNEADATQQRPTYAERRAAQKAAKEAEAQQRRETTEAKRAQSEAKKLAAEQKRQAKLAAKEQRKAELKAAGKFKSKISISFSECKGRYEEFVDTERGAVKVPKAASRATRFGTLEAALEGAREYSEDRGYIVAPYLCKRCSNGHPIWHLRAAAEVDLSKEQEEIRIQVNDFIQSTRASLRQQHAQA